MLFGIPPHLPAELLHVLASMGHADEIALVDSNYPAASDARHTHLGHSLELAGRNLPEAVADILTLMPLDTFDDAPVKVMAAPTADGSVPSVHQAVLDVLATTDASNGNSNRSSDWSLTPLERFAFYEQARRCFAIVRTLERRPYGNVILKMGVIGPDGELMTPERAAAVG